MFRSPLFALGALVILVDTPLSGQQVFIDQIGSSGLPSARGAAQAIYDHDRDGFLDLIWAHGNDPQQLKLMRNNGNLTFTDISSSSGFLSSNGSILALDIDNNGWTDIIESNFEANTIRLQLNNSGILTSHVINVPVDIYGVPIPFDLDRNGAIDLLYPVRLSNGTRSLQLVWNDVCVNSIANSLQQWTTIVGPFASGILPIGYVIDHDRDGDMDLIVVLDGTNSSSPGPDYHYQPIRLYRNDVGSFTDASSGSGLGLGHRSQCTIWDYDNDGDLDLTFGSYDCCDNPNVNRTYRNNGNGTFTDVSSTVVLRTGNQ